MGRAGWALADALGTKTTTLETQLTTELVSDSGSLLLFLSEITVRHVLDPIKFALGWFH